MNPASGPKPGSRGVVIPEVCGSSIISNASDTAVEVNSRLVTALVRDTVMLTAGASESGARIAPPEQVIWISPICSVMPSERSVGVLEVLTLQVNVVEPPPPV
jgi:hypothetical protein